MSITLFGWGPLFGVRGPSPFVLKAEIQLQLLGVEFTRAIADLDTVKKHKAPYVKLDDGSIIEDSTFIRFHFERALGKDLDRGLSAEQRAAAWGLERMFEDRLSFIMAHERWLVPENFKRGPAIFFARVPEAARASVIEGVLDDLAKRQHSQGLGRHSREERMTLAARDITAAARQLGDKRYMFGDRPTALDAAAFGVLTACAAPIFDTELIGLVHEHENLRGYLGRMEAEFFRDGDWPAPPR